MRGVLPGVGILCNTVCTIRGPSAILPQGGEDYADSVGRIVAGQPDSSTPLIELGPGRGDSANTVCRIPTGFCHLALVGHRKLSLVGAFPLSWSHYVQLLSVTTARARAFYEAEAIRGGWSVRQLDRQISTQFYERTSHSKRQAAMLARAR